MGGDGVVVLWCCGIVVLWYCGVVVLWCCGVAVLWCCGIVVLWCCGVVVLWCCRNTLKPKYHNTEVPKTTKAASGGSRNGFAGIFRTSAGTGLAISTGRQYANGYTNARIHRYTYWPWMPLS